MAEENTLVFIPSAGGFGQSDFRVHRMEGVESISELYGIEVQFTCLVEGGIAPGSAEEMIHGTAQVGFGPGGTYRLSGALRELEQLSVEHEGATAEYRAVIVPRVWRMDFTRRSRCFNEKSVPDIIEAVLQEHGFSAGSDYELRLQGSYPVREYTVQYEEGDLRFLRRWMERLGIFWFFEQQPDKEKLVIVDANAELVAAPVNSAVSYAELGGRHDGLHEVRRVHRQVPKKVHVRDFNWRAPGKMIHGVYDVDATYGFGQMAFYGDHFKDDGEGTLYAQMRAEELNVPKTTYSARSENPDYGAGMKVTLSGSPLGELDLEYVLTRVHHESTAGASQHGAHYQNRCEMIAFATPYRAPRVTPWPRIDGVIHAKIDAESVSSAAPINPEGLYRVVFPYDIFGEFGGKATRWVRKAEPYAGPAHGMHFTLHTGAEVLIAHQAGDPDRPLIVGSVPNPNNTSPLTQTHATRSAIRTRSGIMIDFEDDA